MQYDAYRHLTMLFACEPWEHACGRRTASFGAVLLTSVGAAYENTARVGLGGFQSIGASLTGFKRRMGQYYDAVSAVTRVAQVQSKMEKAQQVRPGTKGVV